MRCEECRAALLAGEVTEAVQTHMSTCAACRAEAEPLARAAAKLDDPLLWEGPSPAVRELTVQRIEEAARPKPLRRGRRRWYTAAAAAIAVVTAAGALWLASGGEDPDWEVQIGGTELAESASGLVAGWNVSSGTRVEIAIEGLSPAPAGFYYEVWFSGDGAHVSAGTFTRADELVFHVGASRSDLPNVWISLEPRDGDLASSGNAVMIQN